MKALLIFFLVGIAFSQMGDKEVTQLDFLSDFSLGKQDELNRTFTKIN